MPRGVDYRVARRFRAQARSVVDAQVDVYYDLVPI